MDGSITSRQRLVYFTLLWALMAYFECLGNPGWFTRSETHIYLAAILLALWRPQSVTVLLLLVGAALFHNCTMMRATYTNLFLERHINSAILLIGLWFLTRKSQDRSGDLYEHIAPLLRLFTVALYSFSFFAKLNYDFLDPRYSCAVELLDIVQQEHFAGFEVFFSQLWIRYAIIWFTLGTEIVIPLLLLIPATRPYGIVLGLFFHFLLGLQTQENIYIFSMLMVPLFFVFVSDGAFQRLYAWGEGIRQWFRGVLPSRWLRFLLLATAFYCPLVYNVNHRHDIRDFSIWLMMYLGISLAFIAAMLSPAQCADAPLRKQSFLPKQRWILILMLPFLLNGLAPYLGIKTVGTFSPFNNLQVIGPFPNHYLVPPSWAVFKPDLVWVLDSDLPAFKKKYLNQGYLIADVEFRRIVTTAKQPFYVKFIYRGKSEEMNGRPGMNLSHPLFQPLTWFEQSFIIFRAVDANRHCRC